MTILGAPLDWQFVVVTAVAAFAVWRIVRLVWRTSRSGECNGCEEHGVGDSGELVKLGTRRSGR